MKVYFKFRNNYSPTTLFCEHGCDGGTHNYVENYFGLPQKHVQKRIWQPQKPNNNQSWILMN